MVDKVIETLNILTIIFKIKENKKVNIRLNSENKYG